MNRHKEVILHMFVHLSLSSIKKYGNNNKTTLVQQDLQRRDLNYDVLILQLASNQL